MKKVGEKDKCFDAIQKHLHFTLELTLDECGHSETKNMTQHFFDPLNNEVPE